VQAWKERKKKGGREERRGEATGGVRKKGRKTENNLPYRV